MSTKIVERQVTDAQEAFDSWRFLTTVASACVIILWPNVVWKLDFTVVYFAISTILVLVTALILIWSLHTMRYVMLAVAGFAIALAIRIAYPLQTLVITKYIPERSPFLYLVILAVLYFPAVIIYAGLLIAYSQSSDKALLKPDLSIFTVLFDVAGVPRICDHLPGIYKFLVQLALFFASRTILSFGILWLSISIWSYYFLRSEHAKVIGACNLGLWNGSCILATSLFLFTPILIILVCCGLAGLIRFIAQRLTRTSLEGLISSDPRWPILFLRSFRDDQVRLAPPKRTLLRWLIFLGDPRPLLDHILLENMTPYGPVAAIGAPGARPPFGVARTYVSDQDWKLAVQELSTKALIIVIAVDETPGVRWEIEYISSAKWTKKTLFLLPPGYSDPQRAYDIFRHTITTSSDRTGEGGEAAHVFLDRYRSRTCIVGWFVHHDGTIEILTANAPSDAAYVMALRRFVQVHRLVRS